jgi:hypothetical protein
MVRLTEFLNQKHNFHRQLVQRMIVVFNFSRETNYTQSVCSHALNYTIVIRQASSSQLLACKCIDHEEYYGRMIILQPNSLSEPIIIINFFPSPQSPRGEGFGEL